MLQKNMLKYVQKTFLASRITNKHLKQYRTINSYAFVCIFSDIAFCTKRKMRAQQ